MPPYAYNLSISLINENFKDYCKSIFGNDHTSLEAVTAIEKKMKSIGL